jgi:hypothetical protein
MYWHGTGPEPPGLQHMDEVGRALSETLALGDLRCLTRKRSGLHFMNALLRS